MSDEGRVHPDCRNASNPYHECSEYCFKAIAEAKARMDQSHSAIDDDRVGPLFEHTFPPSLAPASSFIGIPRKSQEKWIAQVLSGIRKLPSRDEMMQSIKDLYHSRDVAGIPKYQSHDIGEFEYCDKYADYTGFPHLEEWKKNIFVITLNNYYTNLETYRDSLDDDDLIKEALQSPHFIEQEEDAQVSPL